MSGKVRHIDYYPDEYIAGIGGQLSAVEQGVYWMICSLVYSRGGPIDDDHVWLSRLFADTHWRTVRSAIDRLVETGKVDRIEGSERPQITVKRCARELQKALTRSSQASQNGRMGGRPSNEINEIPKPEAFSGEKLTTNHQPPTTNQEAISSASPPGKPAKADRTDLEKHWTEFRSVYPKRKGDQNWKIARERFDRHVRDGVEPALIVAGAKRYGEEQIKLGNTGERGQFVKQAASFLSARTWEEYPGASPPAMNGHAPWGLNLDGVPIDWNARLKYYQKTKTWRDEWGRRDGIPADFQLRFEAADSASDQQTSEPEFVNVEGR